MPTPCVAAAAAFALRVTESDLPALRRLSASQRRAFALDLCALLDFATPGGERVSGSPSPNAGGLRAAVMIDHVPGMTSRAACALVDRLSLASRRSVPDVENLQVFEVHDVVIIAHAPRLRDELLGWRGDDARTTRFKRLVDVLPAAEPAMRDADVADALARAADALEAPPATDRGRRREGEEGEEGEEGRDREKNKRRPRDLVAALGALADSVPPPTLVGACLGYPRVYAWSKAGDVAAAARALSSETLRVYEVYARFRGDEKNDPRRRVCGFTAPVRFGEDDAETVARDRDANVWLEAMRERAAVGGDVWTDLRLRVETRSAGPVAL
jgi:hypothetical protein